ncbi:MAG: hypothetical protein FWE30_07225 [Bacteroidales bacterium]|nr:hypothetical protein [Bacteroidales bacterium]MCL2739222.1 hypothetical protein [Bacteroidales bacterium]
MNSECFLVSLNENELMAINGGGFAYDVGRVLRFAWIYATSSHDPAERLANALVDWYENAAK